MARKNKTRDLAYAQKKADRMAVISFVEADILVDGSVYVNLPPRTMITRVISNITTASGTATSTLDVVANGVVLVNELPVAIADIANESLVAAARYLPTGGELVIKAGAVTPATGSLVGELTVGYIELDRNTGEYTKHLDA